MKAWNELSRAEKVQYFFEYPQETRKDRVRELWGEAHEYMGSVTFPRETAWSEIVTITQLAKGETQYIYLTLTEDDFPICESVIH